MDRNNLLTTLVQHSKLVTPSAVALRFVKVTSNPDCTAAEVAATLEQDPVLCGKVLKTVNSCIFAGRAVPIASVERAIVMLGLNPLRSLVLGLALPIAQTKASPNRYVRDFWIDGVTGGILAKELSALREGGSPGYDLVAGLLRDLGALLLMQHDPAAWTEMQRSQGDAWVEDPCGVEERFFGIDHVTVTAELLASWKLPDDVTDPIRFHHRPQGLAGKRKSFFERAELLNFVEALVHLDRVADSPALLKVFLAKAKGLFGLDQQGLVAFLEQVNPKIQEVKKVFDLPPHAANDYAAILSLGCEALVDLSFRSQFGQGSTMAGVGKTMAAGGAAVAEPPKLVNGLPPFHSEFLVNFPAGGCRLDQFELRGELGRGAMGIVYEGYDPKVEREAAVKLLAPEFATCQEARQRFMREARALAAVQHPNVVGVYTVGTVERLPYMAMEYVRGRSLEDLVEQAGPLPVPAVVRYGTQIAAGLAAAHHRGIVHRDIKPANILIAAATDEAKIADFGLAFGIDDLQLTQAGTLIGSPLFMSPEQIEGLPTDERTDLFSLGGVLYVMCTGALPFQGRTIAALVRLIGEVDPVPPRTLRPDLPPSLEQLVMDLLKKSLKERIPSADMVHSRLAKYR